LTAVGTAYASIPFPTFSHPPIKLTGMLPRGRLYWKRRVDKPAIYFGDFFQVSLAEIHV
jgi:hypothetical protein